MMWAWFLSPLGRKISLYVGIALLAFTLFKMWEHKVALEAANREAAKELEDSNKRLEQERKNTQTELLNLQQQREAAERKEAQTQLVLKGLTQQLSNIANQRVLDRDAINRIPDDKLAGDVRARVGLPKNDSLTFTVSEIRVVDETLSAMPTMKQEIEALKIQGKKQEEMTGDVRAQLDAVGKQLQTSLAYTKRLEENYTLAYNTAQKFRRRSWFIPLVTFGLVHRERKIDLPSPLVLSAAKP